MKKINLLIVIFLLTSSLFSAEQKKEKLKIIDVKYVSSKEGLNIRETPSLSSKKIAALIYASEVNVLEIGAKETIDGIDSNWMKIQIPALSWGQKSQSGWVFGGYLVEKLDSPYIIRYKEFKEVDKTYNDYRIQISLDETPKVLRIYHKGKETYRKDISAYCFSSSKDKIFFYSEENYIKGKMIWEMKDRHYSFYELDLKNFSVTELFQNTTVEGGYGLKISANDKYLCYPEAGGEMVGEKYGPRYYKSHGVCGIYDLENKETVITKEGTIFYPIGNGYFLGYEGDFYYSLYDKNLNFIKYINDFKLGYISDEEAIPQAQLIYHNTYPYFFAFSNKNRNYRVTIKDNEVSIKKIENCDYESFIEIDSDVYCLLIQNQNLSIYDKNFEQINSIKCPTIPQNMEIRFIDSENGKIIINIFLMGK